MEDVRQHNYISSLNGLRFIAILMVFLHHLDMFNDLNILGFDRVLNILFEGFIGVNFFYILSGFVISYSYEQRILEGRISKSTFIFNRISKLFPVHILLLICTFFLYGGTKDILHRILSANFISNILLLQSYVPDANFAFSYNGVAWSISTELFFYIVFTYLVKFNSKERKTIYLGLLIVIVFNCIVGKNSPIESWLFYINPIFRMLEFLTGMLLCELYKKSNYNRISKSKATILEVVSILVLIWFIIISISSNIPFRYKAGLFYLIPISFMIYIFSFNKGSISKFLSSKIMNFLGKCSFSFYMVHQIVLYIVKRIFGSYIINFSHLIVFSLCALLLTIFVASIIYIFFEKPIDLKLRKLWLKRIE